jgi:hypothetical protein
VKGCHFQDVPCRRSLCLRDAETSSDAELKTLRMFYCTETISERCPHRGWDHERSLAVRRARSRLLDDCPGCGGRHASLDERLRCTVDRKVNEAFERGGDDCPGSCDPLMPPEVPREMASYAWRGVRKRVYERDGGRCRMCGRELDSMPSWFFEVHHIVPRCEGGSDHPRNLTTLCYLCHRRTTALAGSAVANERSCRQWPRTTV